MPTDFLPAYGPDYLSGPISLVKPILAIMFALMVLYTCYALMGCLYRVSMHASRHLSGLPHPARRPGHLHHAVARRLRSPQADRGSAALVTCKLFGGGHCTTRGELVEGLCLNHQATPEPVLCPRPTCARPRRAGGILCDPCSKLKSFDADRAPVDVMGSPLDWILEGEARAEAEWKREGGAGHDAH